MLIYVAGPLGFSEAGRAFYAATFLPAIAALGHEILDPWTLTDAALFAAVAALPYGEARRDAWRRLNDVVGDNNRQAIDRCDAIVAVLDGVDIDSGTAAEIGYGFARDKPILGYRGDFRLSADNEGAAVNLQVEYFIRRSGGEIVAAVAELGPALRRLEVGTGRRK